MKTKAPRVRRKFASNRDQLDYLYHKLLYWLYEREDRTRAGAFADRLARLLSRASPGHDAIFPEECWSLIYETRRDFRKAIKHRENEIRLIRRLHEISRDKPFEAVALKKGIGRKKQHQITFSAGLALGPARSTRLVSRTIQCFMFPRKMGRIVELPPRR